jgi:hypothetical protein
MSRTGLWRVQLGNKPNRRAKMGEREVRPPWNTTGNEPMRGYSPGSRSSPSRADAGHINPHAGKGWTPVSRRDNSQVVGGNQSPFDGRDPTRNDRR